MRSSFKNGIKERFPSDVGILIHQQLVRIFKGTHARKLNDIKTQVKDKFAKWHRDYVEKIDSIIYPTWQNFDFFRNFHTLISLERVQMKSIQLLIVMTDQKHTYENLRNFYLSPNV